MVISNNLSLLFVFLLFLFIPSFLQVALNISSMALGFSFCILLILLLFKNKLVLSTFLNLTVMLFSFHFFITMIIFNDHSNEKNILSFLLIILCLYATNIFSLKFIKIDNDSLLYFLRNICFILLLLVVFSLFYNIQFLGYDKYPKSVFPFSEPGHFALNIGAIFLFVGIYSTLYIRLILFFALLCVAIFLPSLLLLIISFVLLFFYFLTNIKRLIIVGIMFFIFIFILLNNYDFSYFTDRLNFNSENNNLTALVYLQGWEDTIISFKETYGLGLGFQNMGIQSPGKYAEIIYSITGMYKNRTDGGCLANKVISELGVLGLLLIFLYLYKFLKSIKFIIDFINKNNNCENNHKKILQNKYKAVYVFSHTIIIMFFIELFARGNGYFSTGVFLLILAFFVIGLFNKSFKERSFI